MKYLTIRNNDDAAAVSAVLHDAWFDAEKIKFDASKKTATISFAYKSDALWAEEYDVILVIENVGKYKMKDVEQVGFYDLNEIEWDAEKKCVRFVCGIPLYLEFFLA
jgi:hypothetical protein